MRAASRKGTRASQATRVGAGSSLSTSSSPAPPSTLAVPPSPTSSSRGRPTARISSPSPRLEAASGSSRAGSRGIASADSTAATPSASSSHLAVRDRPKASCTSASCHAPPTAEWRASSVPSPPSATGSATASAPPRWKPSPSAVAAAAALRTPLRLAGHASARTLDLRRPGLPTPPLRDIGLDGAGHPAQGRERQAFVAEEDQSEADADGGLDDLEADPECEAVCVGDAVANQRQRDRRLDEPDVPGPERDDGGDVHQHEHERSGRQIEVDVEGPHRRPNREKLAQPAQALEDDRDGRRERAAHDAQAVARHRHETPDRAEAVEPGPMVMTGREQGEHEDRSSPGQEGHQTRQRPVR